MYDDDWILHFSDQDSEPYFRRINSLDDTLAMTGNCAKGVPGFGHNEMFPCFDSSVTYGLAVTGLAVNGTLPVSLATSGSAGEPNVRIGQPPVPLTGTVTVSGLTKGTSCFLCRYNSTAALPSGPPFVGCTKTAFVAPAATWVYTDPIPFASNSAVYYVAACE